MTMTNEEKQLQARQRYADEINLENALDYLCKVTKRDIFIMLPEDVKQRNPYLIEEIKKTVAML